MLLPLRGTLRLSQLSVDIHVSIFAIPWLGCFSAAVFKNWRNSSEIPPGIHRIADTLKIIYINRSPWIFSNRSLCLRLRRMKRCLRHIAYLLNRFGFSLGTPELHSFESRIQECWDRSNVYPFHIFDLFVDASKKISFKITDQTVRWFDRGYSL